MKTKMVDKKGLVKQPRIGESGNILPDRLPRGQVMSGFKQDIEGAKDGAWKIGKPLGCGGFGEIYLCDQDSARSVEEDANFAMKIEPHANGPLFIERNFYVRAVKPQNVDEYRKNKKCKSIGIPAYGGSGSHTFKGDKYRFLVMDRLGKDLETTFLSGKRKFPPATSFHIALKVLDTLEYVHNQGYAHNDIKAQNLLLGHGNNKENVLYLVDFGLVSRYHRKGVHLQYEPDDRKAHDGTIAYTSRDAHIGAHARRSDFEMLGYNLVHWMSGTLPWMDNLSNYEYVHMQKNGFMEDIRYFLTSCFGEEEYPDVLYDYFTYVMSMEFDTTPDYEKCREMFKQALKKEETPSKTNPDLNEVMKKLKKKIFIEESKAPPKSNLFKTPTKSPLPNRKRRWSEPEKPKFKFEIEDATPRKSPRVNRKKDDKAQDLNKEISDLKISTQTEIPLYTAPVDTWSWERVIGSGNCELSELLLDHDAINTSEDVHASSTLAQEHLELDKKEQKESLENPTPAMKVIMKRLKEKEDKKKDKSLWQHQFKHTAGKTRMGKSPGGKCMGRSFSWDLTPNPLTPAMEDVMRKRSKMTFRRRFRSIGESKEADVQELDLPSCTSRSDEDEHNNQETKSCTKPAKDKSFNSPIQTRSTTGHKPITKSKNNQGDLKPAPTSNVRVLRRRRSSVNNCNLM